MSKPGDIDTNGDKTVEDILGTTACDAANMSQQEKDIKVRDIMFSTSATFDPPANEAKGRKLSDGEWQKIIDATEKKTKWRYVGGASRSCCCTFP